MKRLAVVLGFLFWLGPVLAGLAQDSPPEGMKLIQGGEYRPLYKSEGDTVRQKVADFYLDEYPVTNAEFLEFVKRNPKWSRSRVKKIFADQDYLRHWKGDFEVDSAQLQSPVTHISWFAARAYSKYAGKRLPTVKEWEYAAAASQTAAYGADDPAYNQYILDWYSKPTPKVLPPVGSTFANFWGLYDMHGLVWQWVSDFNNALVSGESRGDSGLERQLFCGSGSIGASDFKDYAAFMRFGFRSSLEATYCVANLGFRCAKDVEEEAF